MSELDWEKSEKGELWSFVRSPSSARSAAIHLNFQTGMYDASVVLDMFNGGGAGVTGQGFNTLEEAQEWAHIIIGGR